MSAPALGPAQRTTFGFEPLIASPAAARLLGNIHVKTLQRYARQQRIPGYQMEVIGIFANRSWTHGSVTR